MIGGYAEHGEIISYTEDGTQTVLGRYRVIATWRVSSPYMGWFTWHAIRATIGGVEYWARYNYDNGSFVALRPVK